MEAPQIENPEIQNQWNEKRIARKSLNLHNQKRREKRQGIYNLTSWHVSRLRRMEENENDDYITFTTYIKWKGGIPPKNDFQDENEYLSELKSIFDSHGGYDFFKKHNLTLPPNGVSIDENPFL